MAVSVRLQDLILMKSDDIKPAFSNSCHRLPQGSTHLNSIRPTIPIIAGSHLDPKHVTCVI